ARAVIGPGIVGRGRSVVGVVKSRSVGAEGSVVARRLIHSLWNRKGCRFARDKIVEVNILVAFDIGAEGDVLTVGRKVMAADFPLAFGQPFDFTGCENAI